MLTSKLHTDGIVLLEGSKTVDELSTGASMDVARCHAGRELTDSAVCILSFPPKFKILASWQDGIALSRDSRSNW